jgi:predicted lysophospholipase L1 biosynthesis ABC-type transport system permease subunit
VINEEMARRFWPGQDAVGKRFKHGLELDAKQPWKTVVGVVANARRQRLDEAAIPFMFQAGIGSSMDLAVRTQGDPDQLREAIRAEIRAVDAGVPPYGIVTVEGFLQRTVALRRLQMLLLVVLAGVALTLAVIGAYGVINQSIAIRTQEIGIRMALGANAGVVLRMLLAAGLAPAIAGVVLGLAASLALARTIATFLYDTSALDPSIYLAVAGLLLAVTAVACVTPARRAAKFDPVAALRNE